MLKTRKFALALSLMAWTAPAALADSITPSSFATALGLGESVTISKTVTISAGDPSGALLDVVFLMDTSGSMGGIIANAKLAAIDLIDGLNAFGDLASGTGYYSDPGSVGVAGPLTTDVTAQIANINALTLCDGGCGGDFPEEGFNGVKEAAEGTAWRAGSNRFVIALGDATFKESDGATQANTIAALAAANATFIGIDFANMTRSDFGGISPQAMATASGGSILSSSIGSAALIDAILEGISTAFSEYHSVSVSDLGGGMPGVGVSVACTSADVGTCVGDAALGDFDRSIARSFTYDVTFTGLEAGLHSFPTHALVERGIVASEDDRITVGVVDVPEPTSLVLLAIGLVGSLRAARRRAI